MSATAPSILVTGPPRSGTSLVMQMLAATHIEPITDGQRSKDPDNPHGYFEHQQVMRLAEETSIFDSTAGKAIKVIHALLQHIPPDLPLAVLFLHRDLSEVLASQSAMLKRLGRPASKLSSEQMRSALARSLATAREGLNKRSGTAVLDIQHQQLIHNPRATSQQIAQFLESRVDHLLDAPAMARCVDPALYRQRADELTH